jgi:DNA transposition AAA+ family ATPase
MTADNTSPSVSYPAHYTADDCRAVRRTLEWLDQPQPDGGKYSQAALARLARISASTLNQIIKGSYATSPSKQLQAVMSAMQHAEVAAEDAALPPVETSVYRQAFSACGMARKYRNFAVFAGRVGIGKTFALKRYARAKANTHMIEATPTMTPQSLVRLLVKVVLGIDASAIKGSMDDKFRAVIDALRGTDSLLIVDEAETLTPNQLHTLRRLRDLADIGVVLAGTEYLTGLIKPERGQFDQIRSRTGYWPETMLVITELDANALIQAHFGKEEVSEDIMKRLFAYSKGSARMLCEGLLAGLKEFRKGREVTLKMVDNVAKDALCLQSLA